MDFKFVNSFTLVWHSDNEFASKTQKLFFILKESSNCHNINYRAKNHDVLFWFAYRSRASSTRTRPTLTHIGCRVNENFPEVLKSQLGKNRNVIHRPRSVRIGRNCALGLSTARGRTQDLGHSFSQYGPPSRWITYICPAMGSTGVRLIFFCREEQVFICVQCRNVPLCLGTGYGV